MQRIAPLQLKVNGEKFDFHLGYTNEPDAEKAIRRLKRLGYNVRTLRVPVSAGPHPRVMRYLYTRKRQKAKARLSR